MDRAGFRQSTDGVARVYFRTSGRPCDLTGYTVAGTATFDGGTPFAVTMDPVAPDGGEFNLLAAAADLDEGDKYLYLEFTFTGDPVINAPEATSRIWVRSQFGEAA